MEFKLIQTVDNINLLETIQKLRISFEYTLNNPEIRLNMNIDNYLELPENIKNHLDKIKQ